MIHWLLSLICCGLIRPVGPTQLAPDLPAGVKEGERKGKEDSQCEGHDRQSGNRHHCVLAQP